MDVLAVQDKKVNKAIFTVNDEGSLIFSLQLSYVVVIFLNFIDFKVDIFFTLPVFLISDYFLIRSQK